MDDRFSQGFTTGVRGEIAIIQHGPPHIGFFGELKEAKGNSLFQYLPRTGCTKP